MATDPRTDWRKIDPRATVRGVDLLPDGHVRLGGVDVDAGESVVLLRARAGGPRGVREIVVKDASGSARVAEVDASLADVASLRRPGPATNGLDVRLRAGGGARFRFGSDGWWTAPLEEPPQLWTAAPAAPLDTFQERIRATEAKDAAAAAPSAETPVPSARGGDPEPAPARPRPAAPAAEVAPPPSPAATPSPSASAPPAARATTPQPTAPSPRASASASPPAPAPAPTPAATAPSVPTAPPAPTTGSPSTGSTSTTGPVALPGLPAVALPLHFTCSRVAPDGSVADAAPREAHLDMRSLQLGETAIRIGDVVLASPRGDRLGVVHKVRTGATMTMVEVQGAGADAVARAVNRLVSERAAVRRLEELAGAGRILEHRTWQCVRCDAIVDLTGRPESPQVYCPWCRTTVTIGEPGPAGEEELRCCDACGLYARLSLIVVSTGAGRRNIDACAPCREEATAAPAGAGRASAGSLGAEQAAEPVDLEDVASLLDDPRMNRDNDPFALLDPANRLYRAGRYVDAATVYAAIVDRAGRAAGVRTSHAFALHFAGDAPAARAQVDAALADCANYAPAEGARSALAP